MGLNTQGPSVPDQGQNQLLCPLEGQKLERRLEPQANFVQNDLKGIGRKGAIYRK